MAKSTNLMNNSFKKMALTSGGVISLFFSIPFVAGTLAGINTKSDLLLPFLIISLMFVGGGVICFTVLTIIRKRERKCNSYAALIGVQKRIPLQWIAQKMNKSVDEAIKDLRDTMSWGMFPDAYIDENNGYLLFPNDEKDSTEIKICPNCGAGVEVIMGYSVKCSYCGQIIE